MTKTNLETEPLHQVLPPSEAPKNQLSLVEAKTARAGKAAIGEIPLFDRYRQKWDNLRSSTQFSTRGRVQSKICDVKEALRSLAEDKGIDPATIDEGLQEVPDTAHFSSQGYIQTVRKTFHSVQLTAFDDELNALEKIAGSDGYCSNSQS